MASNNYQTYYAHSSLFPKAHFDKGVGKTKLRRSMLHT